MTKRINILVVEDDDVLIEHIAKILSSYGRVFKALSKEAALKILRDDSLMITHAFVDLDLEKKLAGLEVIKVCKEKKTKCAVLSSHESQYVVEEGISNGADYYFDKFDFFENYTNIVKVFFSNDDINHNYSNFFKYHYITSDEIIKENISLILSGKISTDRTILINGETGTGKTYLAELLHSESNLKGEFIHFNVSDVNPSTMKKTLFGSVKGSFTGSVKDTKGYFQLADSGTLFLDEIGEMPLEMQKALLTAIETKEVWPEGAEKPVKCNVRLICAGSNLLEKLRNGEFREDLYYRLNDFALNIKPLRSRKEDIVTQAKFYARKFSKNKSLGHVAFSIEALEILKKCEWRGNTRDLKKQIKAIVDLIDKPLIEVTDIPREVLNSVDVSSRPNLFVPDEHINFIEEFGYKKYVETLDYLLVQHYMEDKKQSKYKAGQMMKASKTVFKRIYKTYENFESTPCQ
jgi:two-component system nitrogen regulation response regulator GlnG